MLEKIILSHRKKIFYWRLSEPLGPQTHVRVVGEAGIEPTTPSLEGSCSIQLSYSPARVLY